MIDNQPDLVQPHRLSHKELQSVARAYGVAPEWQAVAGDYLKYAGDDVAEQDRIIASLRANQFQMFKPATKPVAKKNKR